MEKYTMGVDEIADDHAVQETYKAFYISSL